jgi:hypothetical protein
MKEELIEMLERALELLEQLEGNAEALDKAYDMIVEASEVIEKYAVE